MCRKALINCQKLERDARILGNSKKTATLKYFINKDILHYI